MKWGLRWGDPWGRTADHDSPCLAVTALEPIGDGRTWRAKWTWTGGGQKWGYRWGRRWGRTPVWFKVYVNGVLAGATRSTSWTFSAGESDDDPTFAVVAVGPANGDAAYDPLIALETVAGNRARLAWPASTASDRDCYAIYWDSGTGTIDYDTSLAHVDDDGSATFEWTSAPLANGTYKFAVKCVDDAGNESAAALAGDLAIASPPAAPTALAYTYSAATKKVTLTFSGGATVNVYSNAGSGDIDYDTPEASAVTSPWTSGVLTGAATFRYGVRAVDGALEEKNLVYVEFELDASEVEVNVPLSPFGLEVTPGAAGTFTVAGWFDPRRETVHGRTPAAMATIRIYHDNGTGTMDWTNHIGVATLTAGGRGLVRFSYTTGAYANALAVAFGARARTSGGVFDANTGTASGTADASAPAAPASLAATAVRDTGGDR